LIFTAKEEFRVGSVSPADVLSLIRARRSIRHFQSRPVDPSLIDNLLEAAVWAPSAHNRQPWRFVVIVDEAQRRLLADRMAERLASDLRADGLGEKAITADTSRSRARIGSAPILFLVCISMLDMDHYRDAARKNLERMMAVQSASMAAQNLLLMAHAFGLGACWLCAPMFCQDVVTDTLNLPADFEPQGLIAAGYPAESREKTREPLASRVITR
jgi:F420 biosynthesis protein FbiB-like protein